MRNLSLSGIGGCSEYLADDRHDVEFILKKMDKEWGITICDPDMLLGVERKLTVEDGIRFLEFKMPN